MARLGTTQTLAWASSYYLPALLAAPLSAELGLPVTSVFGAFTLALVISALVGPRAGRAIDELGGRTVLLATNVLFALGLASLGLVQSEWQLWAAVETAAEEADQRPQLREVSAAPRQVPRWMGMAMAVVFAITWFTSTAMAAHLPTLLQAQGLSQAAALGVAMLVGPAQVAGRLLEFGFLRHVHPLLSARLAAATHPLGVMGFMAFGPAAAWLFAGLHGTGNGILTIAKGTLPLVVYGTAGYGQRLGWLTAPARITQAAAPVLFGLAVTQWASGALWLTAGLGVLALLMLQAMAAHLPR